MESLSQIYNQNLRLKFGSAPAQLLTKGEEAEKSLEKRASAIKKQFDLNNIVNTKSQISQHLSKHAIQGTMSLNSWSKTKSHSQDDIIGPKIGKKCSKQNMNDISSDDDDDIVKPINDKNLKIRVESSNSSTSSHMSSSSLSTRN